MSVGPLLGPCLFTPAYPLQSTCARSMTQTQTPFTKSMLFQGISKSLHDPCLWILYMGTCPTSVPQGLLKNPCLRALCRIHNIWVIIHPLQDPYLQILYKAESMSQDPLQNPCPSILCKHVSGTMSQHHRIFCASCLMVKATPKMAIDTTIHVR